MNTAQALDSHILKWTGLTTPPSASNDNDYRSNWIEDTCLAVDTQRVFIADSNPSLRGMIVRACKERGHDVVAADSQDALLKYMRTLPKTGANVGDLLITSAKLADRGGVNIVRALMEEEWGLSAVLLTGHRALHLFAESNGVMGDYLLVTSFTWTAFSKAIASLLDRPIARRPLEGDRQGASR